MVNCGEWRTKSVALAYNGYLVRSFSNEQWGRIAVGTGVLRECT